MWIHYRFRHSVRWEKGIPVTGGSITVGELEHAIFSLKLSALEEKKRCRRLAEARILFYNAETGEEYGGDNEEIPANSRVIVHFLTLWSNAFLESKRASQLKVQSSTRIAEEEGKDNSVKRAIRPVRSVWHCLKTPPGYICHRCHVPGHYIQACPTNGDPCYDIKVSKCPSGVSKAPSDKDVVSSNVSVSSTRVPMELNCPLCNEVMKEAVLVRKCCFRSFCDKCIRDLIISTSACTCGATTISVDDLIPNRTLRETIKRLLSSTSDCSENNRSCCLQAQDSEVDHYSKITTLPLSAPKPASTKDSVEAVAISGVTDSLIREACEQFDAPISWLITTGRPTSSSSLGTPNEELWHRSDDNGSRKRVSSDQNVSPLIKLWNTCIAFICPVMFVYFMFPCPENACMLLRIYSCMLFLVTLKFVSCETGGQVRFCMRSSLLQGSQQLVNNIHADDTQLTHPTCVLGAPRTE